MGAKPEDKSDGHGGDCHFDTTRWSIVLEAGHNSSPDSHEALSALCRVYWYPLYAFVRHRVRDVHEAQDLTQEFFCRLVEKGSFALADPKRGRFRSFLLTAMKHFLTNEWKKAKAQKRGGGGQVFSLDLQFGESRYKNEPADELTPERFYEKQWALTLLNQVLKRVHDEYRSSGKEKQFEKLKVYLTARSTPIPYAAVARELAISESTVSVQIHRLRQRYRAALREEIAQTVPSSDEVEDEIQNLFESLGS